MTQTIETFTAAGQSTWSNPGVDTLDYVAVFGGGGGDGGGGGACGLSLNVSVVSGDIDYAVGKGGQSGYNGNYSSWNNGEVQGDGGTCSRYGSAGGTTGAGDLIIAGGNGTASAGGGGAGAGGAGVSAVTTTPGTGGTNGSYNAATHGGSGGASGVDGAQPAGAGGAGAAGGDGGLVIAYTLLPPVITGLGGGASASVSVVEGIAIAVDEDDLTATSSPFISGWSIIGGADAALFSIVRSGDEGGAYIEFVNAAPDYEHPLDADANNVYEVIIRLTNNAGYDEMAISITVTNDPSDDRPPYRPPPRTTAQFNKVLQELILDEYEQRQSRGQGTFKQTSGSTASYNIGQTLKLSGNDYVPADGSACDAVLLKNLVDVATDTETPRVPLLVAGPAVIEQEELEFATGADQDAQVAALLAKRIRCVHRPANFTRGGE